MALSGQKSHSEEFWGHAKTLCFTRDALREHLCGSPDHHIWRCWSSQTGAFPGQVVRRKVKAPGALPAREQQGQGLTSQSFILCYTSTESHGLAKSFGEPMALRKVGGQARKGSPQAGHRTGSAVMCLG